MDYISMIGELYSQLYGATKELQSLKMTLKQKDEKLALLDSKLKLLEKPKEENEPGKTRVSDR